MSGSAASLAGRRGSVLGEQESGGCGRCASVPGPVGHVPLVLTEPDRGAVWRRLVCPRMRRPRRVFAEMYISVMIPGKLIPRDSWGLT